MSDENVATTDAEDRWDDLRETWVDLENGRETRSSEVLEAWRDCDLELVANSDPIPLPDDADVCPDVTLFAFAIPPDWLAGLDGTLSYMDRVFRRSEYELRRQQRDRALEDQARGKQATLELITDGGTDQSASGVGQSGDCWDWRIHGADDLYTDASMRWGGDAQMAKASEEFSELAAVCARDLNRQADRQELLAELVDARIMMEQIAQQVTDEALDSMAQAKLDQLDELLHGGDRDA